MLSAAPGTGTVLGQEALGAALHEAGLADGPLQRVDVLDGPLLRRWSVTTADGEHLWVDQPGPASLQAPGPAPLHGAAPAQAPEPALTSALAAVSGDLHGLTAVRLGGTGRAYRLPWRAHLLAALLLAPPSGGGLSAARLTEECRALGAFLRRIHAPVPTGVSAPPPLPVRRVLHDPPTGSAVARSAALRRVAQRCADGRVEELSLLHGQPGTGHVLVPAETSTVRPRAILIGWEGAVAGDPAFDLGHLVGDLLEVGALTPPGAALGPGDLLAAATALRTAYEQAPGRPLPATFWASARAAACVKVLDHDVRLHQAFGSAQTPTHLLAALAGELCCPSSALGGVLT